MMMMMMMMQDLHPSLPVSRSGPDDGSGVAPNALRVEYVLVNPVHLASDLLFAGLRFYFGNASLYFVCGCAGCGTGETPCAVSVHPIVRGNGPCGGRLSASGSSYDPTNVLCGNDPWP